LCFAQRENNSRKKKSRTNRKVACSVKGGKPLRGRGPFTGPNGTEKRGALRKKNMSFERGGKRQSLARRAKGKKVLRKALPYGGGSLPKRKESAEKGGIYFPEKKKDLMFRKKGGGFSPYRGGIKNSFRGN